MSRLQKWRRCASVSRACPNFSPVLPVLSAYIRSIHSPGSLLWTAGQFYPQSTEYTIASQSESSRHIRNERNHTSGDKSTYDRLLTVSSCLNGIPVCLWSYPWSRALCGNRSNGCNPPCQLLYLDGSGPRRTVRGNGIPLPRHGKRRWGSA